MIALVVLVAAFPAPLFNTLWSNESTTGSTSASTMCTALSNYGANNLVQFYVEDLLDGSAIGYNPFTKGYLASASKAFIAAAYLDSVGSLDSTLVYRPSDWRGEADKGMPPVLFGAALPLSYYLRNMLNHSDTASTDRLMGHLRAREGQNPVRQFMNAHWFGLGVGEITDICHIDREIMASGDANHCVHDMSCDTLEAFRRSNDVYNATGAELSCILSMQLSGSTGNYGRYYDTGENSASPVDAAGLMRRIGSGALLSTADTEWLIETMDDTGDGLVDGREGTSFDAVIVKGGSKRGVRALVGLAFDWGGWPGNYANIVPRYAFAFEARDLFFIESDAATDTLFRTLMDNSVTFLEAH